MPVKHDRIITPDSDPGRFTEEEAALFRAGKCGSIVEYGTINGIVYCGEPSEPGASFGNCAVHNAEMLEEFHPDGTPRRG